MTSVASVASTAAIAAPSISPARSAVVTELYAPPLNAHVWSAYVLECETGRRWIVNHQPHAERQGFAVREVGDGSWVPDEPPAVVREALRVAVESRRGRRNEQDDPIFAAIAEHRELYMRYLQSVADTSMMETAIHRRGGIALSVPRYVTAQELEHQHFEAANEAALVLADTKPTTMDGALALIDYIKVFNERGLRVSKTSYSYPEAWPEMTTRHAEDETVANWAFHVMSNLGETIRNVRPEVLAA